MKKVIIEYPQLPIMEKGKSVNVLKDHMEDKGVQGKPQNILPFIQSKILRKKTVDNAEEKSFNLFEIYLIK